MVAWLPLLLPPPLACPFHMSWPPECACRAPGTPPSRHLEEGEAGQQVSHIAAQRLQRRVGLGHPHGWHFAYEHAVEDVLQLRGHQDLPFDGTDQADEALPDHFGQPVRTKVCSARRVSFPRTRTPGCLTFPLKRQTISACSWQKTSRAEKK